MSANLTFVVFLGTVGETAKVVPSVSTLCILSITLWSSLVAFCPSSFWVFVLVDVCWFALLEFDVCKLAVVGEVPDCITSPWPDLHSYMLINSETVLDPSLDLSAPWRSACVSVGGLSLDDPASVAKMVFPVRDWSLNRLMGKSQWPLLASRI